MVVPGGLRSTPTKTVYEIRSIDEIDIDLYEENGEWYYSTRYTPKTDQAVRQPIPTQEQKRFSSKESAVAEIKAELKYYFVPDSN
jgi:hypothetical protein